MRPICQDCLINNGDLNFDCIKCDKIKLISQKFQEYTKMIEDKLILASKIIENEITSKKGGKLLFINYQTRKIVAHYSLRI